MAGEVPLQGLVRRAVEDADQRIVDHTPADLSRDPLLDLRLGRRDGLTEAADGGVHAADQSREIRRLNVIVRDIGGDDRGSPFDMVA